MSEEIILVAADVDQAAVIGGDTGDIMRIVGRYTENFTKGDPAAVEELAKLLINPRLSDAVEAIKKSTQKEILVVFYTQKGKIVDMMGKKDIMSPVFVTSVTTYFEPADINEGLTYLSRQAEAQQCCTPEIKRELDRLGIVTWAASKTLNLPYAAGVYITSGIKNIGHIADYLGVSQDAAYLFDDKGLEHIKNMGNTPYAKEHIITVPAFNFSTISKAQSDELEDHLEHHFPLAGFDAAYPELYADICKNPGWPAVNWCITAACKWHIAKKRNLTSEIWDVSNVLALHAQELNPLV